MNTLVHRLTSSLTEAMPPKNSKTSSQLTIPLISASSIWTLGWIGTGAWQTRPVEVIEVQAVVYGLIGLLSAAFVVYFITRRIKFAGGITLAGLIPVVIITGWISYPISLFRLSVEMSTSPVELSVDELRIHPPLVPEYVSLRGRLLRELMIKDSYTVQRGDSEHPQIEIVSVYRTPLVSRNWQPDEPVFVVIEDNSWEEFEKDEGGQQIVSGILYPMIPHAGQRNWLRSNRSGIGSVKWFEEKAEFKFDPDQFYLLRYGTPYELRHPFYGLIFWLLGLTTIILAVNFLIWQASRRTANPKDPRLKR